MMNSLPQHEQRADDADGLRRSTGQEAGCRRPMSAPSCPGTTPRSACPRTPPRRRGTPRRRRRSWLRTGRSSRTGATLRSTRRIFQALTGRAETRQQVHPRRDELERTHAHQRGQRSDAPLRHQMKAGAAVRGSAFTRTQPLMDMTFQDFAQTNVMCIYSSGSTIRPDTTFSSYPDIKNVSQLISVERARALPRSSHPERHLSDALNPGRGGAPSSSHPGRPPFRRSGIQVREPGPPSSSHQRRHNLSDALNPGRGSRAPVWSRRVTSHWTPPRGRGYLLPCRVPSCSGQRRRVHERPGFESTSGFPRGCRGLN